MFDIFFVRHGRVGKQTASYGVLDVPLAPDAFSNKRPSVPFEVSEAELYASPSMRTRQTAAWLAGSTSEARVRIDARLVERKLGALEGVALPSNSDVPAHWSIPPDVRPEGGETFDDVVSRVGEFANERIQSRTSAICVTHGGVLRALATLYLNVPHASVGLLDFEPLHGVRLSFSKRVGSLQAFQIALPYWMYK